MPKLTVNGQEVEVPSGATILQACELAGEEIPRFCYHDRLSVAGNCRMCLVELEKSPKPVASCAMPAAEGMAIHTNTPTVEKARKGVMEFLLINHPLDCPICDQGGECDLQDQSMAYGFDRSRYQENKRAVSEKFMGPLIKTIMTRCIQCTRCVRFSTEIAGVEEIGALNRGEHLEISTLEAAVDSELSGNLVDICPVGALTSKPYAFQARPWELRKTLTVDALDAVGSNIRVDTRGREVLRVLPRLHEDINEEWIADKTRHACDGLKYQRLDRPYLRNAAGKLEPASWEAAFRAIAARLDGLAVEKIAALAGDLCDAESMLALKDLMAGLGSPHLDCRQDGARLDPEHRAGYLFNTTIAGIEQADAALLIGTNPRWEAPLINARLRKRFLMGNFPIAAIGPRVDLSYPLDQLGAGPDSLVALAAGEGDFAEILERAKRPMLILGMGAIARDDGTAVMATALQIADRFGLVTDDWNGFNVLHSAAARVGALDLGFVPGEGGKATEEIIAAAGSGEVEVLYLLGADEIDMSALGQAFVIYQGHHGDAGAHRADVILPGAAYTEKNGTYVNTEGRVQLGRLAAFPPGEAREDWTIIRALSALVGDPLPYDSLEELRQRLVEARASFAAVDQIEPAAWPSKWEGTVAEGPPSSDSFVLPIANYYMTDPISRASVTMAACSEAFVDTGRKEAVGG